MKWNGPCRYPPSIDIQLEGGAIAPLPAAFAVNDCQVRGWRQLVSLWQLVPLALLPTGADAINNVTCRSLRPPPSSQPCEAEAFRRGAQRHMLPRP